LQSAVEAGGPIRPAEKERGAPHTNEHSDVLIGTDPNHLPNSSGHLSSAIGKDLSDDSPYAKSHVERRKHSEPQNSYGQV